MKKRILRAISFLLAIAMLTEMLPTAWFSGFMPHVYAADGAAPTETYTASAAAPTDNTIAADIPQMQSSVLRKNLQRCRRYCERNFPIQSLPEN